MLISLSNFVKRLRPRAYKASDAAYSVGGNKGMYIAAFPRAYPKTSQQKKIGEAARSCGIKKGIKKAELQKLMKECIPGKF